MTFSLMKLLKASYWLLNWHTCLQTSSLRHDRRARRCKATTHHVFSAQHNCATEFFLKMWYDSIEKYCCITFASNNSTSRSWPNCHRVAKPGLIQTTMTSLGINLFTKAILLHVKLRQMGIVYCLNNILNASEVKWKSTLLLIACCNVINS